VEQQYVITDGMKYIGKDKSRNITYMTNPDRAEKYTYDKAVNVKDNNIKSTDSDVWYIVPYEPKMIKPKNKLSIVKTLPPAPTELSLAGNKIEFDWNKIIEQIENLLDNIYVYKEQLISQQQYVDWELSDIDHIIGKKSPPAHIRTKIYGIQQQKRKEREAIHNNIRYTNVIIEAIDQGNSLNEIKNRLKGAEPKPYKGRTELYEELLQMIG
jgi:hypothetical protein